MIIVTLVLHDYVKNNLDVKEAFYSGVKYMSFLFVHLMYIILIQYPTTAICEFCACQILNLKGSGVPRELMIKQAVIWHPPSFIPTLPRGCCRRCGSLKAYQMVHQHRRSSPLHQAAASLGSTRPLTTSTAMDLSSSGLVPLVCDPFPHFLSLHHILVN